ncbi:MAG: ssl1498 family light-harvesting-like protein [Cyanobacteria bacterium]|nr:ssl1498 family light-harvesting-like protein [Cyanobacteriota bacterium]MDA1246874.1 ssl1498 family light-harvesting-like protein [Cyanobacteriota bacterium]
MQVTKEDGGRLNAFALEPRMVVMEQGEFSTSRSKMMLIGGSLLVVCLLLLATWVS